MAEQPDPHLRAQKLLRAATELGQIDGKDFGKLQDHLKVNKGKLSPQAEAKLRSLLGKTAEKTRGRVDQLIHFVLDTSAQLSQEQKPGLSESSDQLSIGDFMKPVAPSKKSPGMTIMDDDLIPLPETTSSVQKSQAPKQRPEELVPLGDLPGPIQERFQDMIRDNPQQFVKTYLVPAFAGKFDQLQYIAKGGMGIIVRGRQISLDRNIAIKLNTQMTDPGLVQSFMNEGKHIAKLDFDQNAVAIIETNELKLPLGKLQVLVPYHVLQFVEGAKDGTFLMRAMEKAKKPFPEVAALLLTKQYARGLNAAHKNGVVHRDVKPDNVLIPPDEQGLVSDWIADGDEKSLIKGLQEVAGLKVADFGLAGVRSKQIQSLNLSSPEHAQPVSDKHTLTGDNSIIGTLYYIPPEGYGDSQSAGMPWDVYSLGLVFYAFLTGHDDPLKFSKGIKRGKETTMSYAIKIGGDQNKTPAISEKDPYIKKLLESDPRNSRILEMLQKMTAFNPSERPTLEECLQWIDEILDERSEKTIRAKEAEKKAEMAAKGKRRAAGIGGAIAVALLGTLGGVQLKNRYDRDAAIVAAKAREEERVARERQLAEEREQARLRTEQLIREGDAFLAQKNYDAARAKFREAGATARLEACDREECHDAYTQGLRAHRMGQLTEADEAFADVAARGMVGMDAATRETFGRYRELLQGWETKKPQLDQAARRLAECPANRFNNELRRLIESVGSGDPDASMIIVLARDYYRAHFYPQILIDASTREELSYSERKRYNNRPEVVTFMERWQLFTSAMFEVEPLIGTHPQQPGALEGLQRIHRDDIQDCQNQLNDHITEIDVLTRTIEGERDVSRKAELERELLAKRNSHQTWLSALADSLERLSTYTLQPDSFQSYSEAILTEALTGVHAKLNERITEITVLTRSIERERDASRKEELERELLAKKSSHRMWLFLLIDSLEKLPTFTQQPDSSQSYSEAILAEAFTGVHGKFSLREHAALLAEIRAQNKPAWILAIAERILGAR